MYEISLTPESFDVLFVALNWRGPKTDEEFFSSHATREALKKYVRIDEKGETKLFSREQPAIVRLEDAAFRYLDATFKEARPAQVMTPDRGVVPLYNPVWAGFVIEAMKAMKDAVEIKVEAKSDEPTNGTNRMTKAKK